MGPDGTHGDRAGRDSPNSKTVVRLWAYRGFESHPLRQEQNQEPGRLPSSRSCEALTAEGCQSGRSGTPGERVYLRVPWVRIPPPPPRGRGGGPPAGVLGVFFHPPAPPGAPARKPADARDPLLQLLLTVQV